MKDKIQIETDNRGTFLLIGLGGELSARTGTYFKNIVMGEIRDQGYSHVVFDCSKCDYIDSTGISLMVSIANHLKENSGELGIIAPSEEMRDILAVSSVGPIIREYKDVEEAGRSFS